MTKGMQAQVPGILTGSTPQASACAHRMGVRSRPTSLPTLLMANYCQVESVKLEDDTKRNGFPRAAETP